MSSLFNDSDNDNFSLPEDPIMPMLFLLAGAGLLIYLFFKLYL